MTADGDHQDAPFGELVEQGGRTSGGGGRDDDPVVGGPLGPAQRAVADHQGDVSVAQLGQHRPGLFGKLRVALDADTSAASSARTAVW